MKLAFVTCATLTSVLIAAAVAAGDEAGSKPVRHMVYDVSVGISTVQDLNNFNGHMTSGKGANNAVGTITADVVGFAPENALIIRVSEASDTRKSSPDTVEVLSDGRVAVNPKDTATLNEEEHALVSLLGRSLVADHELTPGNFWRITMGAKGEDVTTYKVISLADDDKVNLDIERRINVGGVQPMEITITGKVLYNYKLSIPLSADLRQHVVIKTTEAQNTSDLSFEYRLKEDSMSSTAAAPASAAPAAMPSAGS